MGASLGTSTVLTAAVAEPGRFDRLVLTIPPTAWEARAAQADRYRALADLAESGGVDAYLAAAAERPVPEPLRGFTNYPSQSVGVAPGLLPAACRGIAGESLPAREKIAQLEQPTLLLAWSDDPVHPLSTAEELVALLPNARLHVAKDGADIRTWGARIAEFIAPD